VSFFSTFCPFQAVERAKIGGGCGTRPAEFFNGWARKQIRDGSEKRSSENLIRQRGQWNDLNPGEFASRASLRSSAKHV
jgi:hypothetical protein